MRALQIIGACLIALAALAASVVFLLRPPHLEAPPQTNLVISGVVAINPGQSRRDNQTIVIRAGRIVEVRDARAGDPAPLCAGCYATPGLIDAHVHTPPRLAIGNQKLFGLLYLAHGVTSVRDVGQSDGSIEAWARAVNTGRQVGPHVYRCGPVLDGREPGWPAARQVLTPAEGRAAVADIAASGADCIKVYNHIDAAAFRSVREEAAARDLPMVGHVPHLVGLGGVGRFDVQHLTGFPYLDATPRWDSDIDTVDLAAMDAAAVDRALRIARAQDAALTPTIINLAMRLSASDPRRFPPPAAAGRLPAFWPATWSSMVGHPETEDAIEAQRSAVARSRDVARAARNMGVDVLAGTDTLMPYVVPGDGLLRELDELALAFDSNEAALEAATRTNGRRIDPGTVGIIAPGYRADILLTTGDPTKDLSAVRDWRVIIGDGRRYDRATVDVWLARYDRHFHSPIYTSVFGLVARMASGSYSSNLKPNAKQAPEMPR